MSRTDYRKYFYFHGLELTKVGSQYVGNCPFCMKDQHFYMNPENGLWDCKSCGETGNPTTFLTKLHAICDTSPISLQPLAENRGLKVETLQQCGVIKSVLTGEYGLPVRNAKGNIINLYKAEEKNGDGHIKYQVYSSPAPCKQQLYLGDRLRKLQTCFICEGHWDALSWTETLQHLQPRGDTLVKKGSPMPEKSLYAESDVVGVPGATTFPEEWVKLFSRRDVILLFDNDEPGQKGTRRLVKQFHQSNVHLNSLRVLRWQQDDPNDIRDLVNSLGYLQAYQHVMGNLGEVKLDETDDEDEQGVVPVECGSFDELVRRFEAADFLMTDAIKDTLAVLLAISLSVTVSGTQLGLRIIGKPGSMKSTLAEIVGCCKALTYSTSKFTGLLSGFNTIKKAQQIANKINGRNMIIKDSDMMIQLPNWKQVESELRDALGDGVIRAEYRNGKSVEISTNFAVTMCGTSYLRQIDNSQLGSRFLDIQIFDTETDAKAIVAKARELERKAMRESISGQRDKDFTKEGVVALGPSTAGFLLSRKSMLEANMEMLDMPASRDAQIGAMGELIAEIRSRVHRIGREELGYRPDTELATRVSQHLDRLAYMLGVVFSSNNQIRVTRRIIQILQRITRDSCYGFQFEIVEALYSLPDGMTVDQLAWRLKLGITQTRKHCDDLIELGILEKKKTRNIYGQGRKAHWYILSDKIRDLYKLAFSRR